MYRAYILLTTVLSLNIICATAQKTETFTVVQYNLKHVIDTTQKDYPMTRPYALVAGTQRSRYDDYYSVMSDMGTPVQKTMTDASGRVFTTTMGGSGDKYFKDFPGNKLTVFSYLNTSLYAIEESIPAIDWKIGKEQKNIKEYKCQKATGSFRGRNYTAWFTEQLPYSNGPWKLGGLPGLILEANDDLNEVIFECVEVTTSADQTLLQYSPSAISVAPDKFKKVQDAYKKDRAAFAGAAAVRPSSGIAAGTIRMSSPAGFENRPPREDNNPIEKEKKP